MDLCSVSVKSVNLSYLPTSGEPEIFLLQRAVSRFRSAVIENTHWMAVQTCELKPLTPFLPAPSSTALMEPAQPVFAKRSPPAAFCCGLFVFFTSVTMQVWKIRIGCAHPLLLAAARRSIPLAVPGRRLASSGCFRQTKQSLSWKKWWDRLSVGEFFCSWTVKR